jgi:hypothetical protein
MPKRENVDKKAPVGHIARHQRRGYHTAVPRIAAKSSSVPKLIKRGCFNDICAIESKPTNENRGRAVSIKKLTILTMVGKITVVNARGTIARGEKKPSMFTPQTAAATTMKSIMYLICR